MSQVCPEIPQAPIAPSRFSFERRHWKTLGLVLGVALILVANLVLRKTLERTPLPYYPVFPNDRVPLTWKLLLPVDLGEAAPRTQNLGTYHWFTTGLTVIKLLEQTFSPSNVFYFLNSALIVASFVFSWWMFRSAVFSYTLTLCMAFGTQFHWLYACSPVECMYLYVIYVEASLLCLLKVLETGQRRWQIGFVGTLVLLALCHEQWLDYLGFLTLGCIFLLVFARAAKTPALGQRTLFVLLASWAIGVLYLAIRLSYGQQQHQPGNESEMIFTYRGTPVLAVEDFLSNVMTYVYLAFSNYFPPFMVSSNSLYYYGAARIMAEQHGYHEAKNHLVAMHHLFYWYFWAGIVFAVFCYFLCRTAKTAIRQRSVPHVHLTLAMLMILCGFAIHALVKYRPYLSVPLLTYKCMTSNVGVAFLLAYGLMYARERLVLRQWLYPAVVIFAWSVIVYGGLTRPAYLSQLSAEIGMGPLPDPCRNLPLRR